MKLSNLILAIISGTALTAAATTAPSSPADSAVEATDALLTLLKSIVEWNSTTGDSSITDPDHDTTATHPELCTHLQRAVVERYGTRDFISTADMLVSLPFKCNTTPASHSASTGGAQSGADVNVNVNATDVVATVTSAMLQYLRLATLDTRAVFQVAAAQVQQRRASASATTQSQAQSQSQSQAQYQAQAHTHPWLCVQDLVLLALAVLWCAAGVGYCALFPPKRRGGRGCRERDWAERKEKGVGRGSDIEGGRSACGGGGEGARKRNVRGLKVDMGLGIDIELDSAGSGEHVALMSLPFAPSGDGGTSSDGDADDLDTDTGRATGFLARIRRGVDVIADKAARKWGGDTEGNRNPEAGLLLPVQDCEREGFEKAKRDEEGLTGVWID